jgi:aminocarboxymuconate-semialdehyde decarboxylase
MGRLVHGWRERQECKVAIKESPEVSVRKLYFDTLTHFGPALNYLVDAFGAPNILLGSDYPFDMGTLECARQVKEWVASGENQDLILSKTASLLLGRK